MRIILVTGKIASAYVIEIANKIKMNYPSIDIEVLTLPIHVAAMINSEYLKRELPKHIDKIKDADLIVVPGYSHGDMREISIILGVPVVKGPRYASDIPWMIRGLLEGYEFSSCEPADEVIIKYQNNIERELLNQQKVQASKRYYFKIGEVPVSPHYPIVISEVYVDSVESLEQYKNEMAFSDMISLGIPHGFQQEQVIELVEKARKQLGKPIGIDTVDFELAKKLACYVDFINGVLAENIGDLIKDLEDFCDKPIILTTSYIDYVSKVRALYKAVKMLHDKGFTKIILDPVLNPPMQGLINSLEAYILIRRIIPNQPLLMGIGNVTELTDVDSHGLNGLLVFIGTELGVEVFLTTESSIKTRGSVREVRRAIDMAVLARELRKPPKDFTINLLLLKNKKKLEFKLPKPHLSVKATCKHQWKSDPAGYFKVVVDHTNREILVQHYRKDSIEPDLEIRSQEPYAILSEIINRGLATLPEHYFYLGYELSKANIALILGKEYVQDHDLFNI